MYLGTNLKHCDVMSIRLSLFPKQQIQDQLNIGWSIPLDETLRTISKLTPSLVIAYSWTVLRSRANPPF